MTKSLFPNYTDTLVPTILSAIDRDRFSPSYGCADRRYWGWKLTDYADASIGRLMKALLLVDAKKYKSEFEALFSYLERVQHPDGSFDQAFPNEHSHGATSFLLSDMADVCLVHPEIFKTYEPMVKRVGHFLVRHDEEHGLISNHLSAAAAGLEKLARLTHNATYSKRAQYYQGLILQHQSSEGWYAEYEGADPSYQTLTIYYLAQLYQSTKDKTLFESLERAVGFISFFAQPDGSFSGEYASRNCEVFYVGGIGLLVHEIPLAAKLLGWIAWSYRESRTVTPFAVDIQNLAPVFTNVLVAEKAVSGELPVAAETESLPFESAPFVEDFPDAGLRLVNSEQYYTIVGWKKGGVVKCFDKEKKEIVIDDCGALLEFPDGRWATTQMLSREHKVNGSTEMMTITSPTYRMRQLLPSPLRFFVLRLLNLSIWKIKLFRELGKKMLVSIFILNTKKTKYSVRREIKLQSGKPIIRDEFTPNGGNLRLVSGKKYSSIHMASSKYFFNQKQV